MRFPIARRLGPRPRTITARSQEKRAIAAVEHSGASSDQKSHDTQGNILSAGPRPDSPRITSREAAESVIEQVRQEANHDAGHMLRTITCFRPQAGDVLQT
jgi:hypothetical protein